MKKIITSAILFTGLFLTSNSLFGQKATTVKKRNCTNCLTSDQLHWTNYAIANPTNDYLQAFIFRALKDEYPNASMVDLLKMQEEGLGENAEYFNIYMKKLTNTYEGDMLIMSITKIFDTKIVVAEDLLKCYNENIQKQTNSPKQVKPITLNKVEEDQAKIYNEKKELRLQEQKEVRSKIYDLKEDSIKYQEFVNESRKYLLEQLKTSNSFPEYSIIPDEKYFGFRIVYRVDYRINYQNVYEKKDLTIVSKQGDEATFLESALLPLEPILVKDYTVTTQASIENIEINYAKGITKVKIKNGEVVFKKYFPPVEMQDLISDKIGGLPNGLYEINYEVGQVMGESFVVTEPTKIKSPAGKILGSVLLVALILFVL